MNEQAAKDDILKTFLNEPSIFHVDVMDNTMLPKELEKRAKIDFVVKPPTMATLAQVGLVINKLPTALMNMEQSAITPAIMLENINEIVEIFCIISWGKKEPFPEWYKPFLLNNCTPQEIYTMFENVLIKSQTGFFLNCLKIAEATNPMTLTKMTE